MQLSLVGLYPIDNRRHTDTSLAPIKTSLLRKHTTPHISCGHGGNASASSNHRFDDNHALLAGVCSFATSGRGGTAAQVGTLEPAMSPRASRNCQKLHSTTAEGWLGPEPALLAAAECSGGCSSPLGSVATKRPRKTYSEESSAGGCVPPADGCAPPAGGCAPPAPAMPTEAQTSTRSEQIGGGGRGWASPREN